GRPTAIGTSTFTVKVDAANGSDTQRLSLRIDPPEYPVILTTTLPATTAGTAYSTTLAAAGGRLPYSWALASGALPPGLTLEPATGTITGTPIEPGNFAVSVVLRDADGEMAWNDYTLKVAAPAKPAIVTTIAPAGQVGVPYALALRAVGG